MRLNYGTNRQARTPLPSGATASASQSAGGSVADSASKARAIIAAYESRTITYAELCARLDALDQEEDRMGSSATYYSGGLGLPTYASALAHYQAMQQAGFIAPPPFGGPPHKPTELKSEGMRAGEIIAWRAWKISDDKLVSVVAECKPWIPTEPMQGDPAAGYGIHAYKSPHGPVLDEYARRGSSVPWVIGEVALWGDVIEHEEGYRAEFARVHSFVTWSEHVSKEQRERISTAYLTVPEYKLDDAA